MFTYSLCMIVKNEEKVLARCLDSFAPLFDEIIVVDTGSDDATKEIAARYTEKIYDFEWCDDFSAARNFAFSKCTGDYIYSCDADEVLDSENKICFANLQKAMLPEVEIVQMKYVETDSTVLNTRREWRAKLFKRIRTFTWTDPVHETVRLEPLVFDSDIEILHLPEGGHHGRRDFSIFQKAYRRGDPFSKNLYAMYASELYKCGESADFIDAIPIFSERIAMPGLDADAYDIAACVLCRAYRTAGDVPRFFQYALKAYASECPPCSEICFELGRYFMEAGHFEEAISWLTLAGTQSTPVIDIRTAGDLPLMALAECEEALGHPDDAAEYRRLATEWTLPEGD